VGNIDINYNLPLAKLFKEKIEGTKPKALIEVCEIILCYLTRAVRKGGCFKSEMIYITSVCLKHIYDKRPASEFQLILKYLPIVIKYPDRIYENKPSKRGEICLVKKVNDIEILCSLEEIMENNQSKYQIATSFMIRDKNYLDDYKLTWSWKGDLPSS
jgi:hypothetical protein